MTFTEPPYDSEPPDDADYRAWLARKREWWKWHQDNPEIWDYFQRFAFEAVNRGRSRISHWLILNRVRWEVWIATTTQGPNEDDYKISNDYFAFYARFWKHTYPQHADLFKTKHMIGEPRDSPLIG